MKLFNIKIRNYLIVIFVALFVLFSNNVYSQYNIKWMTAGSLQSWFSEIGSEIEEGRIKEQQDGMQWPAIYQYQDCEAARGFWIGAKNFTDENGVNYPYKVVHIGPRVTGAGEFFPQEFEMTSKFEPPIVSVDGVTSYNHPTDNDNVDPNLKWDRMIVDVDNSQIGLTMTRKIMQFSQQYHDNYFIYDYTFTNTGNTNDDAAIELPNQTLKGVYFFWQYRNAINFEIGYEIGGNPARWGINTMNDARGDGVGLRPDPPGQQIRAQFSYHGKYVPFPAYDNIGGPIWTKALNIAASDTIGRLSAVQFMGVATLHADKSAVDSTDDPNQPSTTAYVGSDEPETSNNDPYNVIKMTKEYQNWMAQGHKQRHADVVQPDGNFAVPTGDPKIGTGGGFSFANGFGPYDIAPGQSIHIVLAEGMAGISREAATTAGRQYKNEYQSATNDNERAAANLKKNTLVLTGIDSLFQTFHRAISNYESGYNIPEPPLPPKLFNVTSGGDRISLSWTVYDAADPNLDGFEIYRAVGRYDSTYHLLYTANVSERSYDDVTPIRGLNYYYYIVSVGKASANDGSAMTPAGRLISSRYYTQSYDPATLKRQAGTSMDQIRVVPNPFNISAAKELGFGEDQANRLAFFNIPGRCTIKIYSEIGELIKTIEHSDGSGDAFWDSVTSSNQIVVSGIYIALVENNDTGEKKIVKFAIIR